MTASSIHRAANDEQLKARVVALANKEIIYNQKLADTEFGKQLALGFPNVLPLMYPIAVDTEAAYETALAAGRGAPGHDLDIITDGALTSAINAHWPYTDDEREAMKPFATFTSNAMLGMVRVEQGNPNGANYTVYWDEGDPGLLPISPEGVGELSHEYANGGIFNVFVNDEHGEQIKGATTLNIVPPPA